MCEKDRKATKQKVLVINPSMGNLSIKEKDINAPSPLPLDTDVEVVIDLPLDLSDEDVSILKQRVRPFVSIARNNVKLHNDGKGNVVALYNEKGMDALMEIESLCLMSCSSFF